jgi:signal transduction histidine kinase/CheY-like chemotaxis protein
MAIPRTRVFVGCASTLNQLLKAAESLAFRTTHVGFGTISGDIQQAMATRREMEPEAPIGFVADDQPSALAALAGGADEAMVLSQVDAAGLATLLDRVELRARLRGEMQRHHANSAHADKLATLGTLVAGVAHEINNPLSAVMLSVDFMRRQVLPILEAATEVGHAVNAGTAPARDSMTRLGAAISSERQAKGRAAIFDEMALAASSIASVVKDLRIFARTEDASRPELLDVRELSDQVLRLVGRDVFKHGIIERDYATYVPKVVLPRSRITQVIMNLLVNAAHAIAEVKRPMHCVRVSVRSDEDFVALAVHDTGPGIPPEALERIFDPFFTTKRQELGTGLGLSVSRSILRKLGGDVSVESVFGEGATFICFLPLPTPEMIRDAVAPRRPEAPRVAAPPGASVLIVEGDPRLLRSYGRLLNSDYRIMSAHDGEGAIDTLESGSVADVVVLELDLPGDDGPRLLAWLQQNRPKLARRTVIVTASDSEAHYAPLLKGHTGAVLHKPVPGEVLLGTIAHILSRDPDGTE